MSSGPRLLRASGIGLLLWLSLGAAAPKELTPLQILQQALRRHPGRIIEMEQVACKPWRCLQIKSLTTSGQVHKLLFRADTGQLIRDEPQNKPSGQRVPLKGVLPLEELVKRFQGGRLLEVELDFEDGTLVYEVEWLDARGQVWEQTFDAYTGKLLDTHPDD